MRTPFIRMDANASRNFFIGLQRLGELVHILLHAERLRHADHGEDNGARIAFAQRAGVLAALDIFAGVVTPIEAMIWLRCITASSWPSSEAWSIRRSKRGSVRWISRMREMISRNRPRVVIAIHTCLHLGQPAVAAGDVGGVVENGCVEVLLGGEMTENDGFGDARGDCDFAGCGTAEPAFREQVDRDFEQLTTPISAGHTRVGGDSVPGRTACYSVISYCK